ncbi:hypothetical protein LP422_15575 [Janibacter limosus]|uniref:Uncharacterized protein n=1 Tax=Janibacter limosus TaxID=53458 RepID=A0AC61U212_9MICO|nr:hypothetical protein [Janibacter limosus]UUZ44038.1 hypothetical protein LP422_15575 [Janibacter limosus]
MVHTTTLKADLLGVPAARLARRPLVWHVRDRIAPDYLPSPLVHLMRSVARDRAAAGRRQLPRHRRDPPRCPRADRRVPPASRRSRSRRRPAPSRTAASSGSSDASRRPRASSSSSARPAGSPSGTPT